MRVPGAARLALSTCAHASSGAINSPPITRMTVSMNVARFGKNRSLRMVMRTALSSTSADTRPNSAAHSPTVDSLSSADGYAAASMVRAFSIGEGSPDVVDALVDTRTPLLWCRNASDARLVDVRG